MSSHQIYKYSLPLSPGSFHMLLPSGAEILSIGLQDDKVRMWAKVVPHNHKIQNNFYCAFTGYMVPQETGRFLGTIQFCGLVYHYFHMSRS